MALILLAFASCKQKVNQDQTNTNSDQIENGYEDKLFTKADVDTVITQFAPYRITRKVKQDDKGNLLIASYVDIVRYDGTSFSHLAKTEGLDSWHAFDVLEDRKGNIWVASSHSGAFYIESVSGGIRNFTNIVGLAGMRNMCIFEDKDGNIWIGGSSGISRYDGNSFKNYTLTSQEDNNNVSCIMQVQTGEIWVGTRGKTFVYDGKKSKK
ncbi:MAG: two-component regulator propeller domain-containing protein [Saprospiraceae bacterium]|nr:two-component regulator propeller domain-containing protein [Saprospiraceae bacterium]